MKFTRIGDQVEAVQWMRIGDHPDVHIENEQLGWPEGIVVMRHGAQCGFIESYGDMQIVTPGDWIVGPAGNASVVTKEEFERKFVPVINQEEQ